MTSFCFSRWQPRRLHTTSGFVFDDSTSISKPNFIDISYPWLRYNYFRFGRTIVRHIEILLPVSILTIPPYSACHSALGCRISSKSVHSQRKIWCYIGFQDGGHCGAILLLVSDRVTSLFSSYVSFYKQARFRSYSSVRGWDITTSAFKKQTSTILEFYFRFRFRPYPRSRHVILH